MDIWLGRKFMELISQHFSEILAFIGGLVSGISIKIIIDHSRNNTVTQRGNTVGGNMAGRDNIKK
jgi:hypothetical protein